MRAMFNRVMLAMGLVALLAGCAAMPVGTMWRLSRFSADDLRDIDPTRLRVIADVSASQPIDPDAVRLIVTFTDAAGAPTRFDWALTPTEDTVIRAPAIAADTRRVILRLSEASRAEAAALAARAHAWTQDPGQVELRAEWRFAPSTDPTPRTITLSIWLLLDDQRDYLPLIDRAEIGLNPPARSEG